MTGSAVPPGANSPINWTVISSGKPTSELIGIPGAVRNRRSVPATRNANCAIVVHGQHLRRDAGSEHRQLACIEVDQPRVGAAVGHMNNIAKPGQLLE